MSMKNNCKWFLIFFIAFATAVFAGVNAAMSVQASEEKHIIVGGELDYPPFSYLDSKGEPAGFSVDLTRAIAKTMGMSIEIRLKPWADIRKELEAGEIDIILGMFYSAERARIHDFSPPYNIISDAIFARKDSPDVDSINDLHNKEIIVMRGEIMHDYVIKNRLTDKLLLAASTGDALRMLSSGKGEYALLAKLPGLYWVNELKLSNITTVGKAFKPSKNCFAVKKGNTLLLSRFTEGLNILYRTGEYSSLYEKWLGILDQPSISIEIIFKYAPLVIVPLILIIIIFFLWSWMLRNKVDQKTIELQESEKKYRNLIENAQEVILIVQEFKLVLVNRAALNMIGYSVEELIFKPFLDFIHPDDCNRVANNHSKRFKGEEIPPGYSFRIISKDGTIRWVESSVTMISWEGKPAALVFMNDITERKQIEDRVRNIDEDLKESQRIAHVGSWRLHLESNQVVWSEELYKMYGFDPALPPPPYTEHHKLFTRESWEMLSNALSNTRDTGIPYELELETVRQDGSQGWMWVCGEVIRDADGVIVGLRGAAQDVTERKKVEEQIIKSNEELEQKVAQRTSELHETIARLEETNRVFVGRELRMIELKEKIAKLEKK